MSSSSSPLLVDNNRRSRTEIIASIMTLVQNGILVEKIPKKLRLNSRQLKLYLEELTKLGLIRIEQVSGRKVYVTTEKGNKYLRQYLTLKKMLT